MIDIILLVSAIAILQVGGAYVRYTPFAGIMDAKTKRRLFYTDCLVLLFNMSWMTLLVNQLSLNVFTYKCCLTLGWIPFFLAMFFIFPCLPSTVSPPSLSSSYSQMPPRRIS